jgi:hypothetical protein
VASQEAEWKDGLPPDAGAAVFVAVAAVLQRFAPRQRTWPRVEPAFSGPLSRMREKGEQGEAAEAAGAGGDEVPSSPQKEEQNLKGKREKY